MPTLKATLFLLLILLPLYNARHFEGTDEDSADGDKLSPDLQEKREDEAKNKGLDSTKKDTEGAGDSVVQRNLKSSSDKRQDDMPGIWGQSIESKDDDEMQAQLMKLDESEENEERRDEGAAPQPPGLWGREFENKLPKRAGVREREIENKQPPGLWGREIRNKLPKPAGLWERGIENKQPPGLWGREIEKGSPGVSVQDAHNRLPGLWERERQPPGLWGREIKNGPPGLWGRQIENQPQETPFGGQEIENQPQGTPFWRREISRGESWDDIDDKDEVMYDEK